MTSRGALHGSMLRSVVVLSVMLAPLGAAHSCSGSKHFDPMSPRHITDLIVNCDGRGDRIQHACQTALP